jgi:hypothetical protein
VGYLAVGSCGGSSFITVSLSDSESSPLSESEGSLISTSSPETISSESVVEDEDTDSDSIHELA